MQSDFIVMLTKDDLTVPQAREQFLACADLPVKSWGFKNLGLEIAEIKSLIGAMKDHHKSTFLEVVTFDEKSCMEAAQMAVEFGFDYLLGTRYYPSVGKFMRDHHATYFPYGGKVSNHPGQLAGTIEEIVADCKRLQEEGADGIDLLAWRYTSADPALLADAVCKALSIPVCIAGSIDSLDRLETVSKICPHSFTMGSALFNHNFVPSGDFRSNLEAVLGITSALP